MLGFVPLASDRLLAGSRRSVLSRCLATSSSLYMTVCHVEEVLWRRPGGLRQGVNPGHLQWFIADSLLSSDK